MRRLLGFLFCLCAILATPAAAVQQYAPKSGETVMKLVVAGRGNIFVHLYTDKAPKTTARVMKLVREGFYDSQRFHKVIRSPRPFVAQIGDPASKTGNLDDPNMGTGGTGATVPYEETGLSHTEGMVAFASPSPPKSDNKANEDEVKEYRDKGDCQFFFVLGSYTFLDGKYTVFGKVVEGLDVMRTLQKGDRVASITILAK